MTLHDLKNPLSGDMCLLCGSKPDVIGVFVPDDPARLAASRVRQG
jgi:hypothetical protein